MQINPAMLRNPGPARTARVIDPVITALGVTLATAAAAVAHWHGPRAAAAPLLVAAAVWLALLGVRRTAAAVFYPVLNYHGGTPRLPDEPHRSDPMLAAPMLAYARSAAHRVVRYLDPRPARP